MIRCHPSWRSASRTFRRWLTRSLLPTPLHPTRLERSREWSRKSIGRETASRRQQTQPPQPAVRADRELAEMDTNPVEEAQRNKPRCHLRLYLEERVPVTTGDNRAAARSASINRSACAAIPDGRSPCSSWSATNTW